jgi:UPF0176 protein
LFIQCEECEVKHEGCCTPQCIDVTQVPEEEQIEIRRKAKETKRYHRHSKVNLRDAFSKEVN